MAQENKKTLLTKTLIAIGLKEFAKTATEDQLAVAFDSMGEPESKDNAHAADCTCKDCKPESNDARGSNDTAARDARASDARKKMHDALDRRMDSMEAEQQAQGATEAADDEALTALLGAPAKKSKETEGLDKELALDGEGEETPGEGEDGAGEGEEGEGTDENLVTTAPEIPAGERGKTPVPSATDGAVSVLRMLRPIIARSKDKTVRAAYDTARKAVTGGTLQTGTGTYSEFARAAATRGKAANDSLDNKAKQETELQDFYANSRGKNYGKK